MERKKIFYGWWIVLGGSLITATVLVTIVTLSSFYLKPITEEFGITRAAFSVNMTISNLVGVIVAPIAGKMFTKYNMHKIHIFAVIGLALAHASYALAQNIYWMYVSSFFMALFMQPTMLPVTTTITNWFNAKRGTAISITFMGVSIGASILSPVVTFLIGNFGWRVSYACMGALMLIIDLPVILFIFKNKPQDMNMKPYGEGDYQVKVKETVKNAPAKPVQQEYSFEMKYALGKPFFYMFFLGTVLLEIIGMGAMGQLNPCLADFHGQEFVAVFVSMNSLLGIAGKFILGWLSDKIGTMKACTLAYVFYAISFALLMFAQYKIVIFIMLAFYFIGGSIGTVMTPVMTGSIFGPKRFSEFSGVVQMGKIGGAFGGVIAGAIFDITGSYVGAWGAFSAMSLIALALIYGGYKGSRKESAKLIAAGKLD